MAKLTQDTMNVLYEAIVEATLYQEAETLAKEIYDKNPALVKEKMGLETREAYIDFIEKMNRMSMKQSEYFVDQFVSAAFKILKKLSSKEVESFIKNYYNSDFKL